MCHRWVGEGKTLGERRRRPLSVRAEVNRAQIYARNESKQAPVRLLQCLGLRYLSAWIQTDTDGRNELALTHAGSLGK